MPGRKYAAGSRSYRYGFQKQETDPELWGGSISFNFRVEDPRLVRFFSVDPLAASYPHNSPYAFSENRLLDAIEVEGLEAQTLANLFSVSLKGIGNSVTNTKSLLQKATNKRVKAELEKQLTALKSDYAKVMVVKYKLDRMLDTDTEKFLDFFNENEDAIRIGVLAIGEITGGNDAMKAIYGKDIDGNPVSLKERIKSAGWTAFALAGGTILRGVGKIGKVAVGGIIEGYRMSVKGYAVGGTVYKTAAAFEKAVVQLGGKVNDKIALITDVLGQAAGANGWMKATDISKKTGQTFYQIAKGEYASVDKMHGHFELFTGTPGNLKHQGSMNIDGVVNKARNASYDIKY